MSTNLTSTTNDGKTLGAGNPPADLSPVLEFKRLTAQCNRGAFSCGNRDIDKWFREKAFKHHERMLNRVMTAHLTNNPHPVGFYALTMKLEKTSELDRERRFAFRSELGYFNCVQLCWIGVQRSMQRQGIGRILLGKALDDFYEVAIRTGVFAMTLTAIDRATTEFYSKLGFVVYGDTESLTPKMLLPAEAVIDARERSGI